MNRRVFIVAVGLCVACFAIHGCVRDLQTSAAKKPNVLFILADDLGYGDLSCYGQKKFKTPNIDRLANEGVKFTQHYSGSTVCAVCAGQE